MFSDSFVRISALSQNGEEIGKMKSEVTRACFEPVYNVNAEFQIARSDLEMASVLVQMFTYQGILRRKVLLGQVAIGEENCSSPEAQMYWREMLKANGITVDK